MRIDSLEQNRKYLEIFRNFRHGQGANRIRALTHDTYNALIETEDQTIGLVNYLCSNHGYRYVIPRELNSDPIEREFGFYRDGTGSNNLMLLINVNASFKKSLAQFGVKYLDEINSSSRMANHSCADFDDLIQKFEISLSERISENETLACAYCAGWVEARSSVQYDEDVPCVPLEVGKFVNEVSRGGLVVPHMPTFELISIMTPFVKKFATSICCPAILKTAIIAVNECLNIGVPDTFALRMSNVLLRGAHNLFQEKDESRKSGTKKARLNIL